MKYKKIIKDANKLSFKEWSRFCASIWDDIKKDKGDKKPKHPAVFPISLPIKILRCYCTIKDKWVLDPFVGKGTTLFAARELNKSGVGFDTNPKYVEYAKNRLAQEDIFSKSKFKIHNMDSRLLSNVVPKKSIDICITSPPYWKVLSRKRTIQQRAIQDYGNYKGDLSKILKYNEFIQNLTLVFKQVYDVLKNGKYLIVNVQDLRIDKQFIAYHSDLSYALKGIGFIQEDIIIWDKRIETPKGAFPYGYPYKFIINKIHEYILIFRKR